MADGRNNYNWLAEPRYEICGGHGEWQLPGCRVELNISGECHSCWDGKRIQQLLGNLVINALTHGASGAPVRVAVNCDESDVLIEVANNGPALSETTLKQIFEPLKRGLDPEDNARRPRSGALHRQQDCRGTRRGR